MGYMTYGTLHYTQLLYRICIVIVIVFVVVVFVVVIVIVLTIFVWHITCLSLVSQVYQHSLDRLAVVCVSQRMVPTQWCWWKNTQQTAVDLTTMVTVDHCRSRQKANADTWKLHESPESWQDGRGLQCQPSRMGNSHLDPGQTIRMIAGLDRSTVSLEQAIQSWQYVLVGLPCATPRDRSY